MKRRAKMRITVDEWAEKSKRGEVCGILGCKSKPVKRCPHCGLHYCTEHAFVIQTLGHQKKVEKVEQVKDPIREATLERVDLDRRVIPRPSMPKYRIK